MNTSRLNPTVVALAVLFFGFGANADRLDAGLHGGDISDVDSSVRSDANSGMAQEFKEFCLEEIPDQELSIGAQEARKICKDKATKHATRKIAREYRKKSIEAGAQAKTTAAKAAVANKQSQDQAAKSVSDASSAGESAKTALANLNREVVAEEKPDLATLGERKENLQEISSEYEHMARDEKSLQQQAMQRNDRASAEAHRQNFERFMQFAQNAAKLAVGIGKMITARQAFHGQLDQDTLRQVAAATEAGINAQQALQIASQLNSMQGGGGGGGGGGGPIGAGGAGVQTGSASIGSIAKNSSNAGSGTSGLNTTSSSMSDPANFFKSNKGGALATANKVGLGTPTSSASSSDVSEVLREQRATKANAAAAAAAGANKNNTSLGVGAGALSQSGATSAGGGYDSGGGLSSADFGLSANLGDPGFDEKMKDLLGLGKEEGALSEEEKALLQQSRNLASLSGEAKGLNTQGVLEADSVSLFDRTKNRITISLKRGHVINGISAKLK